MSEILAFDPNRRTSAQAIADLAALGYLNRGDVILDVTYGKGRFWTKWRPERLDTNDLDPDLDAGYRFDFGRLPDPWADSYDAVVFDPPFKLNGTGGSHASDEAYGVANPYRPMADIWDDCAAGMDECRRVVKRRGLIVYKTQSQVSGGFVRPMAHWMWDHADTQLGLRLEDELYVVGYRKQPEGRSQRHARSNVSVFQVYRKVRTRR